MWKWENGDPISFQSWRNHNASAITYTTKLMADCRLLVNEMFIQYCARAQDDLPEYNIPKIKLALQESFQQEATKYCTMMLLENLAEPEWISIRCDQNITRDVLCMTPHSGNTLSPNASIKTDLIFYKVPCLMITNHCYLFSWIVSKLSSQNKKNVLPSFTFISSTMQHLAESIDDDIPSFHSFKGLATYHKITHKWKLINGHKWVMGQAAWHVMKISESKYTQSGNTFECDLGTFIASFLICDNKKDCPGEIEHDEIGCICNSTFTLSAKCKYITERGKIRTCSIFYITQKDGSCLTFDQEENTANKLESNTSSLSNNAITTADINHKCQEKGLLPCGRWPSLCYDIKYICIYKLSKNNVLNYCTNGYHLKNCTAIDCSMKYKCPGFYCIPYSYLCDGKWDCPGGFDESIRHQCSNNRNCQNMFKCSISSKCIHVGDICDEITDCPAGDDEYLCSFHLKVCPSSCICVSLAIRCSNVTFTKHALIKPASHYSAIILINCHLMFLKGLLQFQSQPVLLSLNNNNLKQVCSILPHLKRTLNLDLANNYIKLIDGSCFRSGIQIVNINLSSNLLIHFSLLSILHLTHLSHLDLSNNFILSLHSDSSIRVGSLMVITLRNNSLSRISQHSFRGFNVQLVISEKYIICCLSFITMCFSPRLWFQFCKHLLMQNSIQFYSIILVLLIILLNLSSVILFYLSFKRDKRSYRTVDTIVYSIHVKDLLYGIQILILVAFDFYFGDSFPFNQNVWLSHPLCFFIFYISLMHSLLAPLLSGLISFARIMIVMYPLNSQFKRKQFTLNCCIYLWSFVSVTMSIFTIAHWYTYSNLPFRLCSPFVDPSHSQITLKFITCLVCFLNIIAIIFDIVGISKNLAQVKNCCKTSGISVISYLKNDHHGLCKHLYISMLFNILCWIPSGITYLICMFTEEFSLVLMTWVLVAVSSLSSITNPALCIVNKLKEFTKWNLEEGQVLEYINN